MSEFWRNCSHCKKSIPFRTKYWICNVSTCNQKKNAFAFCSVACWDAHLPIYRHKNAWAKEMMSPGKAQVEAVQSANPQRTPSQVRLGTPLGDKRAPSERDILVVASKVKEFIRSESGMNTAHSTLTSLSDEIRRACKRAIENARANGRKTVLNRDF